MMKRPRSPVSVSNLVYNMCQLPTHSRSRENLEYTPLPDQVFDGGGEFRLSIMQGQIVLRGKYFLRQEAIDAYFYRRGIAVPGTMFNLQFIRENGPAGSILIFEDIFYEKARITPFAISRAKILLKVARGPLSEWSMDNQFLSTKNSATLLLHSRSKDLIEPDTWVPLYRMGTILGLYRNDRPVNLEEVEHVIF